jgi:Phage integrase, N-terminal SAM-like domain
MTEQLSSLAYRNFVDTCRSPMTRKYYLKGLDYFMDFLKIERRAYDKILLPERDQRVIQMDICDFISYLRKEGKSSASISLYVAAINKFYSMNDVMLNWKKIKSFMGEHERLQKIGLTPTPKFK